MRIYPDKCRPRQVSRIVYRSLTIVVRQKAGKWYYDLTDPVTGDQTFVMMYFRTRYRAVNHAKAHVRQLSRSDRSR